MGIFLQGLTMGLAYVAPIGPQNLFVINTALTGKGRSALFTALIVIFFDITLALACFYGIGLLMEQAKWLEKTILLLGSLVVICIGIGLLRQTTVLDVSSEVSLPWKKALISACVVTWFNPQAIIDGTIMLGAFRASLPSASGRLFITGVACASLLWFLGLSLFVSYFREKFNEKLLKAVNLICGTVIIFYGLKLLYSYAHLHLSSSF